MNIDTALSITTGALALATIVISTLMSRRVRRQVTKLQAETLVYEGKLQKDADQHRRNMANAMQDNLKLATALSALESENRDLKRLNEIQEITLSALRNSSL